MQCFYPVPAFRMESGDISFVERGKVAQVLNLRCGRCIGCRLTYSHGWAVRIMHEAELYDHASSFITLTYSEDFNPTSLVYADFKRFIRRYVHNFGPTRYFVAGEYGEEDRRPHWHAILFGQAFYDKVYHSTSPKGFKLYRSSDLEGVWPFGFSTIGEVTLESAQYVASYILKRVTGDGAADHYANVDLRTGEVSQLEPEFCQMSRNPGIGAAWFDRHKTDVFGEGKDCVRIGRRAVSVPASYSRRLSLLDEQEAAEVAFRRYKKSFALSEDSSPERRAAIEKTIRRRLNLRKRSL